MAKNIFYHTNKKVNRSISLDVPSDLDYWTENDNRVNFLIRKITNSNYTGYVFIIWIFSLKFVWRKLNYEKN